MEMTIKFILLITTGFGLGMFLLRLQKKVSDYECGMRELANKLQEAEVLLANIPHSIQGSPMILLRTVTGGYLQLNSSGFYGIGLHECNPPGSEQYAVHAFHDGHTFRLTPWRLWDTALEDRIALMRKITEVSGVHVIDPLPETQRRHERIRPLSSTHAMYTEI